MDSEIIRLEETGMNSWPSEERLLYDGWVLNLSSGYSNRANSATPLYESQLSLDEKTVYCEKLFRTRNLPVVFKVFEDDSCANFKTFLMKRGYESKLRISVQTKLLIEDYHVDNVIECSSEGSGWCEWFSRFYCKSADEAEGYYRIIQQIKLPLYLILITYKGRVAGCGMGVLDGRFTGIFNIAVEEELRGKGIGTCITEAILGWGRRNGAEAAWLQVETRNSAANHIYSKLGFIERYRYDYMRKTV